MKKKTIQKGKFHNAADLDFDQQKAFTFQHLSVYLFLSGSLIAISGIYHTFYFHHRFKILRKYKDVGNFNTIHHLTLYIIDRLY